MIYSDNTVAIFTIHFATINTEEMYSQIIPKLVFTIHFATINTSLVIRPEDQVKYLQYTLLLLIRTKTGLEIVLILNLQYTLLLLIQT